MTFPVIVVRTLMGVLPGEVGEEVGRSVRRVGSEVRVQVSEEESRKEGSKEGIFCVGEGLVVGVGVGVVSASHLTWLCPLFLFSA